MLNVLHRSRRLLTVKYTCNRPTANYAAKGKTTVKSHTHTRSNRLGRGAKMPRQWMPTKPEIGIEGDEAASDIKNRYKLLSYNILSQDLLTEHLQLYINIDPALLKWEYRLNKLSEEILSIMPDILCLQEMQFDHLDELVNRIKGERHLQFLFKKKTDHRTDGCAIIYDTKKFVLIEKQDIEYYTPGEPLLNRDQVALLAKFRLCDDPTKVFVVATTHLLYNVRRDDVRTAQIQKLLKTLAKFSASQNEEDDALPVLLTGDFNCEPSSPPYIALLTATSVPTNGTKASATAANETNETKNEETSRDEIVKASAQRLHMIPVDAGQSAASTFQERWITVDYILQSIGTQRSPIHIWSVYKLPTVSECKSVGQIPNRSLGSDHYSLAITFSV